MSKACKKTIRLMLAMSFVAVAIFGLNFGMDMRQDGSMTGCIFDQSVVCPMNYVEHLNHWQQIFVAARLAQAVILTLLVVIVLGGAAVIARMIVLRRNADTAYHVPHSVFRKREIIAKLSDKILRALSDGILNPTLYH